MAAWLTTRQVARMAGCSAVTVVRACRKGQMAAEWGEIIQNPARRQYQTRRKAWRIDPKSGREWAASYQPWGRR